MEEKINIQQKPITHYLQEGDVPKEHREKVLFAISKMVHERNEEVFGAQSTDDLEAQEEIYKTVTEADKIIRAKIKHIVENKDNGDQCTECF